MKTSRFRETQIIAILKQGERVIKVKDLCREHGISDATSYNWKAKYGGAGSVRSQAPQGNRDRTREAETDVCRSRLRESSPEGFARKKALTPSDKRAVVKTMQKTHGISVARSCTAVGLARSAYYQGSVDWQVIDAFNPLVVAHPRWGVWNYIARLRALGQSWNHKRIYRVYRQLGLNHPRRTKRRLPTQPSIAVFVPEATSEVWLADFMSDALYHDTRFRTFNIIDDFNREVLAIAGDTSLRAERVIRVLDRLKVERELPHMIQVDNGPEFLSQPLHKWGKANRVLIYQIQPGCPTQNALIERFNRTYRNEVLNLYLFRSLE
ncbi:MAG: IS3 family transposase [Nitrospirales bacterium]